MVSCVALLCSSLPLCSSGLIYSHQMPDQPTQLFNFLITISLFLTNLCVMPDPGPELRCHAHSATVNCVSSPSLWTFLRVTEGVEIAEARKLAGNVSEESEVTPRRSFSLNIFLHDGDRVNVLVPSCGDNEITPVIKNNSVHSGGYLFIHYALVGFNKVVFDRAGFVVTVIPQLHSF